MGIVERLWILPGAVTTALLPHLTNYPTCPDIGGNDCETRNDLDQTRMYYSIRRRGYTDSSARRASSQYWAEKNSLPPSLAVTLVLDGFLQWH